MSLLKRLPFLVVLVWLVAACGGVAVPTPTSGPSTLTVFDWSGYEEPELWRAFAAQHPDVEVQFSFFAENPEALTKVQSGFVADVVHPCSSYFGLFVEAGLMQPIDTSKLSNWSGVIEKLAQEGNIDGQQYFIPWDWGYEAILVRTDKVPNPPTSWADLWKPEFAGRLALQDAGEVNFVTTAHMLGFDPWNTSEAETAQVRERMTELAANALTYWSDSTALQQQIAAGDVWVAANVWTDVFLSLKEQGIPVAYITPSEGRLGWMCGYGILRSSTNVDLAHDYLNALLDPQSMAYMSNQYAYGAGNGAALPLTEPQLVAALQLDQPDLFASTLFYRAIEQRHNDLFNAVWSEVKAAQ